MGILDFFRGKGAGRGVEELARRVGIEAALLQSIKPDYREFRIAKRSGGERVIHAPGPKLKEIQRLVLRRVLRRMRAHPAAHGFEQGRSIVTNARPHTGKAVVVHLDLKDFFTSTSAKRVEALFRAFGWNHEASRLLTRLTTHQGGLPQGAPTSPRLANLVNFHLDQRIEGAVAHAASLPFVFDAETRKVLPPRYPNLRAAYTRYADDITLSFSEDASAAVGPMINLVRYIMFEYGYSVHKRRKMSVRRKHQQQCVTGLVVNGPAPRLPRKTRRRLRAVEHHLRTGRPATLNEKQLAGWRALQSMIESQSKTP